MEQQQSEPREAETGASGAGASVLVTVRYWAAARKASGVAEEKHSGATVAEVLDAARAAHQDSDQFATVLSVCSFLHGEEPLGSRDLSAVRVASGDVIDVLPPFAGG